MRLVPVALLVCAGLACASPGPRAPPSGTGDDDAREVVIRFARALEACRLDEARALLSARWRAAYTPARLGVDLAGAGPAAREAAARAAAAAGSTPLRREGARALLPVGPGREAVLVAEAGGWRLDALE